MSKNNDFHPMRPSRVLPRLLLSVGFLVCVALWSVVLVLLPSVAWPATYYVAPPPAGQLGNPCVDGGTTTRRATITDGIACLHSGDTLVIGAGTYVETIPGHLIPSGSAGAPTTLRAEQPRQATAQPVDSQFLDHKAVLMLGDQQRAKGQHHITVEGLVFDLINAPNGGGLNLNYALAGDPSPHHFVMDNIEIKNAWMWNDTANGAGVGIGFASDDSVLKNCSIHDLYRGSQNNVAFWQYGVYGVTGANNVVDNCEFYNITGYAIHQYTSGGACNNTIIRNNFFRDTGPLLLDWCALGGSNNAVYNNLLLRVGSAGTTDRRGMNIRNSGNLYANNTIVNGGKAGESGNNECMYIDGDNNRAQNNICYGNVNNAITVASGRTGNVLSPNLIGTNPQFVSSNPQVPTDFQIQSGSPAKDAGVSVGVPTDYGGNTRVGPPDIGAWEFGASPPVESADPLAWWQFEEHSGLSAADSSGNLHTLSWTAPPGPGWGPGKIARSALHCDGSSSVATAAGLIATLQYTWMTWVQGATAPAVGAVDQLLFINSNVAGRGQFAFFWGSNDACCVTAASHQTSAGTFVVARITAPLQAGRWYHVAGTFDGTVVRIYLNGQQQAQTPASSAQAVTAPMTVCGAADVLLDGTKIWNRALSSTEILTEYQGTVGHPARHSTMQGLH